MPTIEVPLKPWIEIPALRKSKKFQKLADEMVELTEQVKMLEARRAELSLEQYDILNEALDDDTKSIEYRGYRLTRRAPGKVGRFDVKKLMKRPIPCIKCKTANHVTADVVDECKTFSDVRPGVSVTAIKREDDDDE